MDLGRLFASLSLKDAFEKAKVATNYDAEFIYLNANKANYGKDEIESAFIFADGLETSSIVRILNGKNLPYFVSYITFKRRNGYK